MKNKHCLFVSIVAMVLGILVGCEAEDLNVTVEGEEEMITTSIVEGFNIDDVVVDISNEPAIPEDKFQVYMHHMTHQKVYAEAKRGVFQATPQNVKYLIEVLNRDGVTYENADFYKESLDQWKVGNFSNAVEVHNTIWDWQEGEGKVGRAIRLLTPEEEEAFLDEHFR